MFSKSKLLVLFLAVCVFAAPETKTATSGQFSFVQGVGVYQPRLFNLDAMYFTCKKLVNGKGAISFSWSLPGMKADNGKISVFTVAGKLIRSFDIKSQEGRISWNMPSRMASGVYFATLTYGAFKKNAKILY
ncbi:MAG TPA: T9SS type A sorting domain-containing protein [Chitinivibrionales bacterium]|nr:T9SS type A sorting domain-containing protein [Chitinivibrionales bacterium]